MPDHVAANLVAAVSETRQWQRLRPCRAGVPHHPAEHAVPADLANH